MKPLSSLSLLLLFLAAPLHAELPVAELKRDTPVNFATEVYPFLKQNCLACHNSTKAKADLILESPQDMIRGGDTGPAIEPGNGNNSFLFTTAAHIEEPTMPPANNKSKAGNLSPEELALLKRWIDEGAEGDVVSTRAPDSWTQLRGPQPIYTSAISPDGRFAVAGRGQEIDLYDLRLGSRVASLVDPDLEHPTAHRDLVQSLAFSPDGRVASGGYRNVKIWKRSSPSTGESLALPEDATAVAASPDASRFAVGLKNGSILLVTPSDGSLRAAPIKDHSAPVSALVFSPDGKILFSGSADKTIRKRPVDQPESSTALALPAPITELALLAGGKLLAAGGNDQVIRILHSDLVTPVKPAKPAPAPAPAPAPEANSAEAPKAAPKPTPAIPWAEWKPHSQPVRALAANDREVIVGYEDGTVIIAGIDPGKPEAAPAETRRISHGGKLEFLFTTPSSLVTAGLSGAIKTWNPGDGKLLHQLEGDPRLAPRLDSLNRQTTIATRVKAHWDKKVPEEEKLWKAESEKARNAGEAIAKARRDLASKEAELAKLKASSPATAEDALAKAAEAVTAAKRTLTGAIRNRDSAARLAGDAFSRNTAALSASLESGAIVAALKTEEEALKKSLEEARTKTARTALALSPDRSHLIESLPGGGLRLWSTTSGQWLEDLPAAPTSSFVTASTPEELLLVGPDRKALLLRLPGTSWTLEKTLGDGVSSTPFVDRVSALAFAPDGSHLLTGTGVPSRGGEVSLWETANWSEVQRNREAHHDTITSFAFSPDGSRFASGGTDQLVRVFGTESLEEVKVFEGHTSHVLDVAWNPDNLTLASSGADLEAKVWDFEEGRQQSKVEGFQKEVSAVAFLGASGTLLTASGDKTLKLANQPLPESGVTFLHSAEVSEDGKLIIAGGQDSVLRVWDSNTKHLIHSFSSPRADPSTLASE